MSPFNNNGLEHQIVLLYFIIVNLRSWKASLSGLVELL